MISRLSAEGRMFPSYDIIDSQWNGRDVSCGTHHVMNEPRPSARISYCKQWTRRAWERGYPPSPVPLFLLAQNLSPKCVALGHWLLTETWFSSSYYVCVFHRLTCCVLRLMLSRTFSPVWETTLIHHFNYTLVIFIREWWWRLPKILLRGLPSMLRLTWDLWYGRQGWLHYISLVHVK